MSEIPQWAKDKAVSLGRHEAETGGFDFYASCAACIALARYIAEHEEPPVDPLLVEAREIAANEVIHGADFHWRHTEAVAIALVALKRGIELSRTLDGSQK